MTVQLRNITKDNWFDVTQLQISEDNGKKFIVPIVYSMAESRFEKHLIMKAIYSEDELVGFIMYGEDPDDQNYWIYVFMIDKDHQRKGYGRAALIKLVEYISKKHHVNSIYLGQKPDNYIAESLYTSIGFQDTGKRINREIIREYCCGEIGEANQRTTLQG